MVFFNLMAFSWGFNGVLMVCASSSVSWKSWFQSLKVIFCTPIILMSFTHTLIHSLSGVVVLLAFILLLSVFILHSCQESLNTRHQSYPMCFIYRSMGTLLWCTKTPKNVHFGATTIVYSVKHLNANSAVTILFIIKNVFVLFKSVNINVVWTGHIVVIDLDLGNHVNGLMQKRCNSIANALELRVFHINP